MVSVTWDQILAFRLRRQLLDPVGDVAAAAVVQRLCGVQAQVASAAEQAVGVRQTVPGRDALARELGERRLLRTWAMRGTLHVLLPEEAGAYLALAGAGRYWERGSWQRTFGVSAEEMVELVDAVAAILDGGRVLSREELMTEVVERLGRPELEEQLRSGWGAVLKPVAWQGFLCHAPVDGNRVAFARPDAWPGWQGVPDPLDAARVVIPAYLRAYGPATMTTFDAWLTRGTSKKPPLRSWFAELGDLLTTVEIEGEDGGQPAYLRAEDIDELAATSPTDAVRLLPAFDQYVLGPGTTAAAVVPPGRRSEISKTAGWISPVVVSGGRVAGVWETTDGDLRVRLFGEAGPVPAKALEAEATRLAAVLGQDLALAVTHD